MKLASLLGENIAPTAIISSPVSSRHEKDTLEFFNFMTDIKREKNWSNLDLNPKML